MRKNENTWTQGRQYYTLGSIGGIVGRHTLADFKTYYETYSNEDILTLK